MENHTLLLLLTMIGIPLVIGSIWAFLTRPDKHYYKWCGSGFKKFKY